MYQADFVHTDFYANSSFFEWKGTEIAIQFLAIAVWQAKHQFYLCEVSLIWIVGDLILYWINWNCSITFCVQLLQAFYKYILISA